MIVYAIITKQGDERKILRNLFCIFKNQIDFSWQSCDRKNNKINKTVMFLNEKTIRTNLNSDIYTI